MDLIKIGRYIAGKRKALGMTQMQLAGKLGMSDKSVSKWERGVCLPDVSVYSELCTILGISINEFLAGEDIARENMIEKAEENLIGVAADSKHRQQRLKAVIGILLAITVLAAALIGFHVFRTLLPQNFIAPVDRDSIEMKTAELFAGPDGAFLYRFTTTDAYSRLRLSVSTYCAGELLGKDTVMELGFDGVGSPKAGELLLVPDFNHYVVNIVIAADGTKGSTEYPILEGVADREYYGRAAAQISESTDIRYNGEQALLALIYDNDKLRTLDVNELMDGRTDALAENDYVYFFTFEFIKK